MSIRNYTSSVPVNRSVGIIEEKLVAFGAKNFLKSYDDNKRLSGLCFQIELPDRRLFAIQLPARVEQVQRLMKAELSPRRRITNEALYEQAERTAWKNLCEWVDIQLLLIRLQQVDFVEVFMPYLWNGKSTYYEFHRDDNFRALPFSGNTSKE